jgi:hypothetical protein
MLLLAFVLGGQQTAVGFGFGSVVIAKTGDSAEFISFNDGVIFLPGQSPAPSINAGGEVAFWATTGELGLEEGIFKGAGAQVTEIARTNSGFVEFDHLPALNSAGTVAFAGLDGAAGFGVWTGAGGALTTIKTIDGPGTTGYFGFGNPSINGIGRVSFFAEKDTGVELLTRIAPGAFYNVIGTSGLWFDEFPGSPYYGVPGLNDSSQPAFYAVTDGGALGVFASNLPVVTSPIVVADTDTYPDLLDFRDPVINASGRVAFWASADAGERILFFENGVLYTVVDTLVANSFGFGELGDPALGDDGSIAFWSLLEDGNQGIFFVDSQGEISRVLGTGDSLLGSTVEELGLGNKGLNSQGDMAIWAMLADGSEVILRTVDLCPLDPQHDIDGDGVCGDIDNCPNISNSDQADIDLDGVGNACDNCTLIANGPAAPDAGGASQRDGDGDGYGNACDPDFDQNNVVNFADLAAMKKVFFKTDLVADLNGDGVVNFSDLAILKKSFFKPPGPAAGRP